ncbi:MAG: TetR/AcrR family transcriptional regulator [Treponemataceae bacterium]|nr:TetR/AcrR family transcriptional regulator [Spirochaetales bacterium]MDY6030360.1 TetR/AcrR family transcriptional regulator [Treponemataceae bacterium]
MRKPNTEIKKIIKEKSLELLMQKNPEQIGMREIAAACGITATNIYHYYKDKDRLFQEISLDCLYKLNIRLTKATQKEKTIKKQIQSAIEAYRDWCFENPRRALLVMQGIKSADDASPEVIEEYYVCNRTGERLLKEAVRQGIAKSTNPRLDVSILVSGLWGCIESVLLKKSEPDYWEKGNTYTDRFIKLWITSIFGGDE